MAWRDAASIVVLRNEIRTVRPGTTVWTLGDEAHQQTWSDHNPNQCCDVVCAADVLGDAGLDLQWLADTITATDPPALKYVIWGQSIWFPGLGWQPYFGEYHSHVHVSVGWGPDGRSTGPYDDTSPWGLLPAPAPPNEEESDMHRIRSGKANDGSIYLAPGFAAPSGRAAAWGLTPALNGTYATVPLYQLPEGMAVGECPIYDVQPGPWPAAGGGAGATAAQVVDELVHRLED